MSEPDPSPWAAPDFFAAKPAVDWPCGSDGYPQAPGCTREELIERCRAPSPYVTVVWVPESPRLLVPEEVPYLRPALRERRYARATATLRWSGVLLPAVALAFFTPGLSPVLRLIAILVCVAFGARVVGAFVTRRGSRALTDADFDALALGIRHESWLSSRPVTFTHWLIGGLAAVFLVGLVREGVAIQAVGLIKNRVGVEPWRLITGALMHANWFHIFGNSSVLASAGRAVEIHAHRAYVPIVFLVAAVVGSLFSVWLVPANSLGASGAVLGLVGFHAVIGYRKRAVLPESAFRDTLVPIGLVAALGLFGYQYIDNAAHLGGLLAGVALGLLMLGPKEPQAFATPGRAIVVAGWVALGGLGLSALFAIAQIFAARE